MKYYSIIIVCLILILSGCADLGRTPEKVISPDEEIFQKAESFYQSKTFYRALSEYEKYLKKYPSSAKAADASYRIGEINLALENLDAAKAAFDKTIKNYASSGKALEARIGILDILGKEGGHEAVIKKSSEFITEELPNDFKSRILKIRGDSFLALKDYPSACLAYSEAIQMAGDSEKPILKDQIRKSASLIDTANLRNLIKASKNAVLKSYLLFQLGLNLEAENNFLEAASAFRSFLEEFPDHELAKEADLKLKEIASKDPYSKSTIGCILPLSGKYKIFGAQAQKGIELALASFKPAEGGKQVKFVIKDTASRDDKAAEAVKELAEMGAMAIVGPVGPAESAVKQAQLNGIPIISLTSKDHITASGEYVFRNFLTTQMQAEAAVKYAYERLGAKSFAILYPEDEYGKSMVKYFEDSIAKRNGSIYAKSSYPPGLTDFTAFIKRVAPAQTNSSDPNSINTKPYDVLFIPDGPKNAGLILSQLNIHSLGNIQVMGTNLWNSPKLIQTAGQSAEGIIFPDGFIASSLRPNVQDFVTKFSGAYGENPGFIEAISFDSATILFDLVSRTDTVSREDLKNKLHGLSNSNGVTGMTGFDEKGEAYKDLYMIKVENGGFSELR